MRKKDLKAKLTLILKKDDYEVYVFKPKIFELYLKFEKVSFLRKIRFLLSLFYGYKIYYLLKDTIIIGYCFVFDGTNPRYKFADKNDIIVGPYYIKENYRGNNLSSFLLDIVLKKSGLKYENAYDYIHVNNIASKKTSEKVGFIPYKSIAISKYLRRILFVENEKCDYIVYLYKHLYKTDNKEEI